MKFSRAETGTKIPEEQKLSVINEPNPRKQKISRNLTPRIKKTSRRLGEALAKSSKVFRQATSLYINNGLKVWIYQ